MTDCHSDFKGQYCVFCCSCFHLPFRSHQKKTLICLLIILCYLLLSCVVLLVIFLIIMLGLKSSTVKVYGHAAKPAGGLEKEE